MTARYLARRLIQAALAAVVVLVLTFLMLHAAPGDPVVALAGEFGDERFYELVRERFGLDRPLGSQLLTYLGNVFRGDFGVSFVHGRSALAVVLERLPATLLLTGTALALSSAGGVVLGTLAARHRGRPMDLALRIGGLLGHATPSFWLAQIAVLTLAVGTGVFPVYGFTDPRGTGGGIWLVLDVLRHLALPALVLAATEVALVMRLLRAGLLETLELDYVRTARAKGLSERAVVRHARRAALLPTVTVIGSRTGFLLSGAVLVEIVFAWPGVGRLLLSSVQARDIPVVLAIFLVTSLTVIAANLITDLVYGWLDPRIRYR